MKSAVKSNPFLLPTSRLTTNPIQSKIKIGDVVTGATGFYVGYGGSSINLKKLFTNNIQKFELLYNSLDCNDKDFVTIYDISNCTKYSKKHFNERIKYYEEAQYPYGIFEIPEQGWKSTVK